MTGIHGHFTTGFGMQLPSTSATSIFSLQLWTALVDALGLTVATHLLLGRDLLEVGHLVTHNYLLVGVTSWRLSEERHSNKGLFFRQRNSKKVSSRFAIILLGGTAYQYRIEDAMSRPESFMLKSEMRQCSGWTR